MKTTTSQTAARFLLDGLAETGIEYLFCNFGTDHAPIIEEMARMESAGLPFPRPILCPHENTAMHMAGGYALATGRGQGVMVHVDVGTANAAMGMHNLFRTRLPVLLMAGKAPYTSLGELPGTRDDYVHFVQEPMDQGSIVRPFAKWEYTLPSGAVAKETVRRAHTLMQSDPPGPVHLMFARETLAEHWQPEAIRSFPDKSHAPQKAGGIDAGRIAALAARLLQAERPMLVTGYGGRHRRTSDAIAALSRIAGVRVFENAPVINIGREFAGFGGFGVGEALRRADFGLMVDTDVPWIPRDTAPHPQAYWAHIDIDTVKKAIPMWSFPAAERIEANAGQVIEQLVEAIGAGASPAFKAAAATRWQAMEAEFAARKAKAAQLAAAPGAPEAISVEYFAAELGKRLDPEDTVLSEAVTNNPVFARQIPRPVACTMIRHSGSGLGAAGGLALGVKLARPQHRAVHIIGDGGFYFGNLDSVLAVSRAHALPIFSIIVDNAGWNAVRDATLRVYPDGTAKERDAFQSRLPSGMDFSKLAAVSGAYGECLSDPAQAGAAIERCLAEVDRGRSALLHVRVAPI
jgi:acetolactate synthase I/II/III large subunit